MPERHEYLGGHDIAAIIGASRYAGPYDVYLRKVERTEIPDNSAMEWGRRLEGSVAQAYADRTGHQLTQPGTILHPTYPFIGGTADFLITDDPNRLLECKTSTEEALRETDEDGEPLWGPEGSDLIPVDYNVQTQMYMGLTGRRKADLAAFFLGRRREFRIYHIDFDRELFDHLIQHGVAFWRDHIEAKRPPQIDPSPSRLVRSHLLTRAQAGGKALPIPADLAALALDLEVAQARRADAEDLEESIKARMIEAMAGLGAQKLQGEADGAKYSLAILGGGEGKPVTEYRAIALELAGRLGLPAIPPELEADFTRSGNPKKPYLMPYFTAVRNARKKAAAAQTA